MLSSPLPAPVGAPARIDTVRPATARARNGGLELELWVSPGPVSSGQWVSATARITNVGNVPIRFQQDAWDPSCGPFDIRLRLDDLYPPTPTPTTPNEAAFADRFLSSSAFSPRLIGWREDGSYPCADNGVDASLDPGASLETVVAVPLGYPWRSQPLPGGVAQVRADVEFRREDRGGQAGASGMVTVAAPLEVVGTPVEYAGPTVFLDRLLADDAFTAWLATRDMRSGWSINLVGRVGAPFAGGPAPFDSVDLEVSAEGAGDGGLLQRSFDLWTGDEVARPGR